MILGSGAGSKLSAWALGQRGQRVAVIERKYIGGACPKHRLLTEQEHHPQREGRLLFGQR